jgi:hypothetical protein
MVRFIFICLILFSALGLNAQPNTIGTRWYYGGTVNGPGSSFELKTIEVIDTLTLDGKFAYKITGDCGSFTSSEYLSIENKNMYFYYDPSISFYDTSGWLKTYNFNLNVGQSDTCFLPIGDFSMPANRYIRYLVDSTKSITTLNGQNLKMQYIRGLSNSGYSLGNPVLEDVGSLQYCMLPTSGLNDGVWSPLLCYEQNGQTVWSSNGVSCDSIVFTNSPITPHSFWKVSNPSGSYFTVIPSDPQRKYSLMLYNALGQQIKNIELSGDNVIYTTEYQPGVYFYKIRNSFGEHTSGVLQKSL